MIGVSNIFTINKAYQVLNTSVSDETIEGVPSAQFIRAMSSASKQRKLDGGGRGGRGLERSRRGSGSTEEVIKTDTNLECDAVKAISSIVDAEGTVSMWVIISGFSDNFTDAQVIADCTYLAEHHLCIDVANLKARIDSKKPYKMFKTWSRSSFSIVAKLVKAVSFRCAPKANEDREEYPVVMWTDGSLHSFGGVTFSNHYLIIAVANGTDYKNYISHAEATPAVVIRAAVMTEAEMGSSDC